MLQYILLLFISLNNSKFDTHFISTYIALFYDVSIPSIAMPN